MHPLDLCHLTYEKSPRGDLLAYVLEFRLASSISLLSRPRHTGMVVGLAPARIGRSADSSSRRESSQASLPSFDRARPAPQLRLPWHRRPYPGDRKRHRGAGRRGRARFIMALDFEGHGIGRILIQQCSRVLEAPNQHTFLTRWNP